MTEPGRQREGDEDGAPQGCGRHGDVLPSAMQIAGVTVPVLPKPLHQVTEEFDHAGTLRRAQGLSSRPRAASDRSRSTASSTDSAVPRTISVSKNRLRPRRMKNPTQPWPISAVIVTSP